MKDYKINTFKIAATYIGTVIGAGFASGQELLQFFVLYGYKGLLGLLLVTVLFVYFGYKIMSCGRLLNATSHQAIISYTCGKWFGGILDAIITFFLFGALTAMIAGTGALVHELFHIPPIWGNLLMTFITLLTVMRGLKGIVNAISIVMPFLLTASIAICIGVLMILPIPAGGILLSTSQSQIMAPWWWSAILYISYNLILSVAILGPLGAKAKSNNAIKWGALFGGLGLGLSALAIFLAVSLTFSASSQLQIPMIYIAGKISVLAQLVYAFVLIAEIYTTAVGSLYGFVARLFSQKEAIPKPFIMGAAFFSLLASQVGFTNLVKYYYPFTGYCGIVFLLSLVFVHSKPLFEKSRMLQASDMKRKMKKRRNFFRNF